MALLEYDIQYDDKTGTSKVTLRVIGVDERDRIRFKSNDSNTGIQYVGGSPFSDLTAPQPDKVFKVGKKTGEFEVTRSLTRTLHFKCGEVVSVVKERAAAASEHGTVDVPPTPNGQTLKLKAWKGGGDTPNGR
jgi:hypothetical protein